MTAPCATTRTVSQASSATRRSSAGTTRSKRAPIVSPPRKRLSFGTTPRNAWTNASSSSAAGIEESFEPMSSLSSGQISTSRVGSDDGRRLGRPGQARADHAVDTDVLEELAGGQGLGASLVGERDGVGGDRAACVVEVRDRAVPHQVEAPAHGPRIVARRRGSGRPCAAASRRRVRARGRSQPTTIAMSSTSRPETSGSTREAVHRVDRVRERQHGGDRLEHGRPSRRAGRAARRGGTAGGRTPGMNWTAWNSVRAKALTNRPSAMPSTAFDDGDDARAATRAGDVEAEQPTRADGRDDAPGRRRRAPKASA